jgi:hypothetical protein
MAFNFSDFTLDFDASRARVGSRDGQEHPSTSYYASYTYLDGRSVFRQSFVFESIRFAFVMLFCVSVACIRPCMASALLFRGRLEEVSSCILHRASAPRVKDSSTRDGRLSRTKFDPDIDSRPLPT